MIAETAARFSSNTPPDLAFAKPLVVGAEKHEKLLQDALPIARMILEPMARNSAPAVAAACLAYAAEDLVLILSADHDIQDVAAFHRSEEHTSELQSPCNLVCRLLLEKKKNNKTKKKKKQHIITLH